ncbi:MAG: S-layer homology domain-containing protein [Xenococcaceae cyanobacterium MO_234.B1]|nr:S-layer homology domain-containing protein [Xenococcaceae cyanobacterium MO_234.B1]
MDEWIAVLVAFSVIGTILFSSFGTKSLDWKNVFSTKEGGLFSFSEDRETTDDTKLTLERDSDLTTEEELTDSASLTTPQAPSGSLSPLDFGSGESGDFGLGGLAPNEAQRERVNNLLPLPIPTVTLPGVELPGTEPTTPEVAPESETPVTAATEPTTPEVTPESETPVTAATEPTTPEVAFKDVPEAHWAYPFIQTLGENNLIIATSGNNFEPDKLITRGGMADLVSHTFQDNPENLPIKSFKDVSLDNPRFADINKAVKIGFMKGYSDQKFHPELQIPRYQVLVTLATGLGLTTDGDPDNILARFSDRDQIPAWAREQVAAAIQSNLAVNRPGFDFSSFKPNEPATRAEVAAMIYQALVKSDKLQPIESTHILPNP